MAYPVLETVERLLDNLFPENVGLRGMEIASCTESASILKGVVSLVYNRAVLKPTMCPLYAQLCSELDTRLAAFPSEEAFGEEIKFKRLLINKCQKVFERDGEWCAEIEQMTALDQELQPIDKQTLVKLGNVRLICELWKQSMLTDGILHRVIKKLLGMDKEGCPTLENVEAISQLLQTVGKQIDERPAQRKLMDVYFQRLDEVARAAESAVRVVSTLVHLRSNNWEPSPPPPLLEAATEIHQLEELEEKSSDTNNNQDDDFEDALERTTITEHLSEEDLSERNMGNSSNHNGLLSIVISMGLKKSPPCTNRVSELLEHLLAKKFITVKDVANGCVSYGRMLNFLGTYNPRAPHEFGEIMGKLVLVAGLDFGVVKEVLEAITRCDSIRKMVFNATIRVVGSSPSSKHVLAAQASEIKACRLCCGLL